MGPHRIRQPADRIFQSGSATVHLKWEAGLGNKKTTDFNRKQQVCDAEVIRRMTKTDIHPWLNGDLVRFATRSTHIGSGNVRQELPYARRQYYEHKSKGKWFEVMKNRDKDAIQKAVENA